MKTDLLIDSSGYALKVLQKILNTNIEIKGLKNLPKDHPRIFVANHFTRMEAIVVPYWLYHKTDIKVGVIADDSIFVDYFGTFLKNIGALSKSHPDRDEIITSDLLQGRKDWLIFPEGRMVKGKRIVKEDNHYAVKIDGRTKKVYTGAAYFGLSSQLLREDYIHKKIKNKKEFCNKFFLNSLKDITKKETMIVPINISYSPIRNGNNIFLEMAKKIFGDKLNKFLLEEIEIEGNIILNSKIIIQILKPISLKEITKEIQLKEDCIGDVCDPDKLLQNHQDFICEYKRDLTNEFMKRVYENTTIRFNHIFILVLYFFCDKTITIDHLKKMIYLIAKELRTKKLFFDDNIKTDEIIKLVSFEPFEPFDNVLQLALRDKIVTITDKGTLAISKDNILEGYTHHTIRLKNILKVVLNEVLIMDKVVTLVQSYTMLSEKSINNKLLNHLIDEDEKEYQKDYRRFRCVDDIKDKDKGKSYFIDVQDNDTAVIAIHGFCASPLELKEIVTLLKTNNINSFTPRLKGHGTTPRDLKNVTWQQWYYSVSRAITIASLKYKNLYILGFSIGGLLALLGSIKDNKNIKGIICINAALQLRDLRVKTLAPAVNLWNDIVSSIQISDLSREYVKNTSEAPDTNYDKHYIKSIVQLNKLIDKTKDKLSKVSKPILIIQGENDPVVETSSANEIYENISSHDKKLFFIDADNHIIVKGEHTQSIYDEIFKFIKKKS